MPACFQDGQGNRTITLVEVASSHHGKHVYRFSWSFEWQKLGGKPVRGTSRMLRPCIRVGTSCGLVCRRDEWLAGGADLTILFVIGVPNASEGDMEGSEYPVTIGPRG